MIETWPLIDETTTKRNSFLLLRPQSLTLDHEETLTTDEDAFLFFCLSFSLLRSLLVVIATHQHDVL
jgi:hypothetical protein